MQWRTCIIFNHAVVDHAWLPVDVFMCTVSTPLYAWSVILSIMTMGSVYKCKEQEEGIILVNNSITSH